MTSDRQLVRVLGIPGAVLLGLGAMVGTGIYVSIGLAAGVAGAAVLPALLLAAVLATCNGLSSAQLAAIHPVSGGTYEYGYRYLNSWLGFLAGWLFLVAKSASAATAALGFAGYLRSLANADENLHVPIALVLVTALTLTVIAGMRSSSRVNAVLVLISVGALLAFVVGAAPTAWTQRDVAFTGMLPADSAGVAAVLHATALMFVAFTGYGRVATLGEEVVSPRRTIPRAIVWTICITFALYVLVAAVAIGSTSAAALGAAARDGLPLSWIAMQLGKPGLAHVVAVGALFALAGVLLNLILGLSRVVLAMARRGDMPTQLSRLNVASTSAPAAVIAVGMLVGVIAAFGSIKTAWSFSAFTVLLYYAITNLAALRVPAAERFVPRAVAVVGLVGCAGLAWFVERHIWLTGVAVLLAGIAWHWLARRRSRA